MTVLADRHKVLDKVLGAAREANHPRELLDFVLVVIQEHLRATWGTVWLFDPDSDTWYIACSRGLDADANALRFPRGAALPCRVGESGVPLRVGDFDSTQEFQRFHPVHYRMRSGLYLPMTMGHRPLGVVGLYSSARHAFDADDESFGCLVTGYVGFAVACLVMRDQRDRLALHDERDRLAQGLHDGMLQTLSSLRLYASELETALAAGAAEEARVQAKSLVNEVEESLEEVQAAIAALRWVVVYEKIEDTIKRMQGRLRAAGLDVVVDVEDGHWAPDISDALAAVVHEAITNILKHSRATFCRIQLAVADDIARLTVEDNGTGPVRKETSGPPDQHLGLQLLRERIGKFGGTVETFVAANQGFTVQCRIPLINP